MQDEWFVKMGFYHQTWLNVILISIQNAYVVMWNFLLLSHKWYINKVLHVF
jgi:hypothetical protein